MPKKSKSRCTKSAVSDEEAERMEMAKIAARDLILSVGLTRGLRYLASETRTLAEDRWREGLVADARVFDQGTSDLGRLADRLDRRFDQILAK